MAHDEPAVGNGAVPDPPGQTSEEIARAAWRRAWAAENRGLVLYKAQGVLAARVERSQDELRTDISVAFRALGVEMPDSRMARGPRDRLPSYRELEQFAERIEESVDHLQVVATGPHKAITPTPPSDPTKTLVRALDTAIGRWVRVALTLIIGGALTFAGERLFIWLFITKH